MNYALIRENDIANGPGIRTSLFVSGCRHHCKGCFNPETWNFNYGTSFTQKEIDFIIEATRPSFVDGLTLLGGEPFEPENQSALIDLLKQFKQQIPDKNPTSPNVLKIGDNISLVLTSFLPFFCGATSRGNCDKSIIVFLLRKSE